MDRHYYMIDLHICTFSFCIVIWQQGWGFTWLFLHFLCLSQTGPSLCSLCAFLQLHPTCSSHSASRPRLNHKQVSDVHCGRTGELRLPSQIIFTLVFCTFFRLFTLLVYLRSYTQKVKVIAAWDLRIVSDIHWHIFWCTSKDKTWGSKG